MNKENQVVDKIIETLDKRIGFSYWWLNLDDDIKEEIKEELYCIFNLREEKSYPYIGYLDKKDDIWFVKWSDLHSFGHGNHWMWTELHPSQLIKKNFNQGDKVEFRFVSDNENLLTSEYVIIK